MNARRLVSLALASIAMAFSSNAARGQIPVVPAPREWLVAPHTAAYFLEKLPSGDEVRWREGQIGLIVRGVESIPGLAELARRDDRVLRKRVRQVLVAGMLSTLPWSEINKEMDLASLVGDDVERGLAMAKELAQETERPVPQGFAPDPMDAFKRPLLNKFKSLSGCAVPAAQWLAACEEPLNRGRALMLFEHLNARIGRPDVQRMLDVDAKTPFLPGPMMAPGVGRYPLRERAARFESQLSPKACYLGQEIAINVNRILASEGVDDKFERLTYAVQTYALRDDEDRLKEIKNEDYFRFMQDRVTWDRWWAAARAVWPAWRETLGGAASTPADLDRFTQWNTRRTGRYTLERVSNDDGSGALRVLEPVGGICTVIKFVPPSRRVEEQEEVIASGKIPLEIRETMPSITIRATADDDKPWEVHLATNAGKTYTVRFYKERLD